MWGSREKGFIKVNSGLKCQQAPHRRRRHALLGFQVKLWCILGKACLCTSFQCTVVTASFKYYKQPDGVMKSRPIRFQTSHPITFLGIGTYQMNLSVILPSNQTRASSRISPGVCRCHCDVAKQHPHQKEPGDATQLRLKDDCAWWIN